MSIRDFFLGKKRTDRAWTYEVNGKVHRFKDKKPKRAAFRWGRYTLWGSMIYCCLKQIGLIGLFLMVGCAHNSLMPGAERRYVGERVYIFGTDEQIDRHCSKGIDYHDDGTPVGTEGTSLACCTEFRPWSKWRFRIWVSEGNLDCVAHEECHIMIWKGELEGPHKRCAGFGRNAEGRL